MPEKKIWKIYHLYENPFQLWDREKTVTVVEGELIEIVQATEEEIKTFIEGDWNPICLKDQITEIEHREYEAKEQIFDTIEDLKKLLFKEDKIDGTEC